MAVHGIKQQEDGIKPKEAVIHSYIHPDTSSPPSNASGSCSGVYGKKRAQQPGIDMEDRVSFNEKEVRCKSSYSDLIVVMLLFSRGKEGKHSGKCNRVHCGRVEQDKEQKGFSTYA